ncbi:MAG: hypothetical protein GY937_05265, partial [bacterium]|nr:hypothetical protein [bacterium]
APIQVADPTGPGTEVVYDVHTDHLDTPRMLTNASEASVWRQSHESFGAAVVDPTSTVALNTRFPGQYADGETGLHYNRFRSYDPATGRYINADPIGQGGGSNLYVYGASNPQYWVDASGLETGSPIPGTKGKLRGVIERDPNGRPHVHVLDKKGKRIGTEGVGREPDGSPTPHDGQTLDDSNVPERYKEPIRDWADDKVRKQEDALPPEEPNSQFTPLPPPPPWYQPFLWPGQCSPPGINPFLKSGRVR